MTTKLKKWLRILAVLLGLLALGCAAAPWFLLVDSGPCTANAEVVLGGEPWTRPTRAAEVYHEIVTGAPRTSAINSQSSTINSPLVLVSGNGDCEDVRRQMEAKGVPATNIVTECQSRTTQENALLSVKLLRARGVTNVVIVTSWYHSRRAMACFQSAAPEIAFYSRPTVMPASKSWWPNQYERKRITQEYAKILYYWVAHGVSPFL